MWKTSHGKESPILHQLKPTTVAIKNRFTTHCLQLPKDELSIDPFNYLVSQQPNVMDSIDAELQKVPNMKVGIPFPSTLWNLWTMTKSQLYSILFWLEMLIASQMKSILTTWTNLWLSSTYSLLVVLDGWLKVLKVSKSKQQHSRPSTGSLTLRHLTFWRDFQRVFWTWETKRTFLFFVLCSSLNLFFRRSTNLTKIAQRECQTTEFQHKANANAFIQYSTIREKQQRLH